MTGFREAFPILLVDDVVRAIDFYVEAFGFEQAYRWPAEGEPEFAFLRLEPLGIGLGARAGADDPDERFALWLYADDVDAAAARLRASGAEELAPPADQPWGERVAQFRDPDGHRLIVGSRP